jgi:hypothetical protein
MTSAREIQAGLRIVSTILVTIMALYGLDFLLRLLLRGFDLIHAGKLATLLWLCWSVYTGKVGARVFLVALLLMLGATALLLGFSEGGGLGILAVTISFLEIVGAIGLFAIPQVNVYFEYASKQ